MTDFEATNLFAQQEANRRKSRWLVAGFVVFFLWLGLGGDWIAYEYTKGLPPEQYRHGFPVLGAIMVLIAGGLVVNIRRSGASKVLWSTGAQRLDEPATQDERTISNVVDEMAIAAGIPRPTVWVIDDDDPNAFATGMKLDASHVAVTRGLMTTLNRDELQAVVGHEMGHIKNLDVQLMTLVAGLGGAIALIADGIGRMLWHGSHSRRHGGGFSGGGGGGGRKKNDLGPLIVVLIVVWILSWLLAPLVTRLLAMSISRKREYLADAMSAQFTRNPLALASALEKIEQAAAPTKSIKHGVAHLCIADPLGWRSSRREGRVSDLLATHPPMASRIARLRQMGFEPASV